MVDLRVEEEFEQLARRLEVHHELFSCLWSIGAPVFTELIDTAAIVFAPNGAPVKFLFNPKFWATLPGYDREFVVCHEMLHIVLNHGFRAKDLANHDLMNIAADIAVNHLLVERFGFVRELLKNWERACWVDTVFRNHANGIQTNLTMEEYYALLLRADLIQTPPPLDTHLFAPSSLGSIRNARSAREVDEMLDRLIPHLRSELSECLGAEGRAIAARGTEAVGSWCSVTEAPIPDVPWEEIVRKRLRLGFGREAETWTREHRRVGGFEGLVLLGLSDQHPHFDRKTRQRCAFFLDASSSVFDLRDRFFALVRSLPESHYDIALYSFDTHVYELDVKRPVVCGGGGTSFNCLETYLLSRIQRSALGASSGRVPYPDVVFVLTDGYGDEVFPKHPERWHWLLTSDYKECIPPHSVRFRLAEFT